MCDEEKNTENGFTDGNELDDITGKMARRYYDTHSEAESKRRKGERIYYKAGEGYYIVRPKKPSESAVEEPLSTLLASYRKTYEEAFGIKQSKREKKR